MKKKKMFNRVITIILSAVMLVSAIPFTQVKAEPATGGSLDSFKNPTGSVDDYSTGENPYGYGDGQIFTMSTQDELFSFISYDMNNSGKALSTAGVFSQFQPGEVDENNIASARMALLSATSGSNLPFASGSSTSIGAAGEYTLYHMQAVAFDPFNTGHNDHVAILGVDKDGMGRLYVMEAATWKIIGSTKFLRNPDLAGNNTQAFEASNFLAITAGRYTAYDKNNPAGETLVVYFPCKATNPVLMEFKVNKDGSIDFVAENTSFLHKDYMTGHYGKLMQDEEQTYNHLAVSLATGDFDGDRIDDLVVLSSITDPSGKYKNVSYQYFMPELFVAYGGGSGSILSKNAAKKEIAIWSDDNTEMRTFTSPSVTAGDADGDGLDDVIAAGWQLKVVKESANSAGVKNYNLVSGATIGIWKGNNKSLSQLVLKNFDDVDEDDEAENITNRWTERMKQSADNNFNDTGANYILPQYAVEAVAINGDGAADYIFMNGTFCRFDQSEGLKHVFTPEYFQHDDRKVEGHTSNAQYIASAAVGVFDHNTVGREQLIISVGLKNEGESDYSFMLGTMGGYGYNDKKDKSGKVTEYGAAEKIYTTAFDRSAYDKSEYDYGSGDDYQVFDRGNSDGQYLNCLVAAVDIGNDGVLARYRGKQLLYTDPNLVAVLQAAPYFEELDDTEGSTTYTFGTEYTIGEQSAKSTSFSIGVSAELEGPGVKVAAGSGYTSTWSESFSKDVTESYSTSFEASGNNQVILQRTPLVLYHYDVQYAGTDWDNEIQVSIPAEPLFVQLSVDEYNAFAAEFNAANSGAYDGNKLKLIDTANDANAKYLLDNEGNPAGYLRAWTSMEGAKNLSKSTYSISTSDSGSITAEYSSGTSTGETKEKSDGFYVNASVGAGASFLLGSAYVGIDTSVEGEKTLGTYETTTTYTAVSGSVTNLGGVDDVPANILSQYMFSWTFGKWSIQLDTVNPAIPVYGYQVASVTRPAGAPENLTAETGAEADEVIISWDAVDGATGYLIYNIDVTGKRSEIGKIEPTSGTPDTSFTYTVDSKTPFYAFVVSALNGTTEGSMSDRVIYYPESSGLSGKDGITPQLRISDDTNEWEVSYDGGATWASLGVKATGEAGANGQDGQDGKDGNDGKDGADGITPDFRINPENNMWEVSYDEGVTWASLNVTATGEAGKDGIDGITPQFRINPEDNMWEVSYDMGTTWGSLDVEATGPAGKDGKDGKDGIDGKDGADGQDGVNGKDGTDGQDGIDGQNGTNGKDGINGQNGSTGRDGLNGQDGKDGKDGKDGIDGKDGKDGNGIADIKINEDGEFIFTMTDGSTINAGKVPQAEDDIEEPHATVEELNQAKTVATGAVAVASVSLLWNVVALAAALLKKKNGI